MKIVLQRVKNAQVDVSGQTVGKIGSGALIFLGIAQGDTKEQVDALIAKISHLRMFEDANGKMNIDANEAKASFLVISQFTLYGDCSKGRRPSFDKAADPKLAEDLYNYFIGELSKHHETVQSGQFAAMMDVSLINDGPVTFILENP